LKQGDPLLHGYIAALGNVPALARSDSIWFYGVAREGYTGSAPDSRLTPAFLPLYPLLMRGVGAVAGCEFFAAGVWVSGLSLVAAAWLLANYAGEREGLPMWAAVVTLLAFPSAYVLCAVYSETLFLALALAAFLLARSERYSLAVVASFLAGLTRIHGLALVPALAVLGCENLRRRRLARNAGPLAPGVGAEKDESDVHPQTSAGAHREPSHWIVFLPAVGALTAYLAIGAYFWIALGDPLAYFKAKRDGWAQVVVAPWQTLETAVEQLDLALDCRDLGTIYTALELPCFYLIVVSLGDLCARRRWSEATYVLCAAAMSVCSGSLVGLPRFTLVMFPVFVVLARLRRWPVLWGLYLTAGAVLQGCLLVNYVRFAGPPP
jgi:hypothetical protein